MLNFIRYYIEKTQGKMDLLLNYLRCISCYNKSFPARNSNIFMKLLTKDVHSGKNTKEYIKLLKLLLASGAKLIFRINYLNLLQVFFDKE